MEFTVRNIRVSCKGATQQTPPWERRPLPGWHCADPADHYTIVIKNLTTGKQTSFSYYSGLDRMFYPDANTLPKLIKAFKIYLSVCEEGTTSFDHYWAKHYQRACRANFPYKDWSNHVQKANRFMEVIGATTTADLLAEIKSIRKAIRNKEVA